MSAVFRSRKIFEFFYEFRMFVVPLIPGQNVCLQRHLRASVVMVVTDIYNAVGSPDKKQQQALSVECSKVVSAKEVFVHKGVSELAFRIVLAGKGKEVPVPGVS